MAIETDYEEMFSEVVILVPPASMDKYGKHSYTASAGASCAAHIVAEILVLRDAQGREVVQTGKAYLYGTPTVAVTYRIILPDADTPVVLAVDEVVAEDGPHHTVVRFGEG